MIKDKKLSGMNNTLVLNHLKKGSEMVKNKKLSGISDALILN